MLNDISAVFHNGWNYDYHFILKQLANKFEKKFECLLENTKKCERFSIWIEKEVAKIHKNANENVVTISYTVYLIDSAKII